MDIHSDCNEQHERGANIFFPSQWWILRHYWSLQNQWRGSPFSCWSQSLVLQIGDCIYLIHCPHLASWRRLNSDFSSSLVRKFKHQEKTTWKALIYASVGLSMSLSHNEATLIAFTVKSSKWHQSGVALVNAGLRNDITCIKIALVMYISMLKLSRTQMDMTAVRDTIYTISLRKNASSRSSFTA